MMRSVRLIGSVSLVALLGLLGLIGLALGGCVRAPEPIDIAALIARRGPIEARRDLAIRVLDNPRDVAARLALAALAEQVGRPSEAIEQLEAVQRLGGPIGTRWHDSDRARLGRLLLARGRARLARDAATADADLQRARTLGAEPMADELARADLAIALADLRHVDARVRARGRTRIGRRASTTTASSEASAWLGARGGAPPLERGRFGAWLWTIGARREAYEQLVVWHDATSPPRDEALQAAYLRAVVWWSPVWLGEVPPPPPEDLVGPERCWFPGADCMPVPPTPGALPPVVDLPASQSALPVVATVRFAATRFSGAPSARALADVAVAYERDPAMAERVARDVVASATDAAVAHASLGALFDAVGDRSLARAQWQEAATLSAEPGFLRGLAEACARGGDGAAAIVFATTAAAASGDPAVVWNAVAAALLESKQNVDALAAAKRALELAGPEQLPRGLDFAIAASRALGRRTQADELALQRAKIAPRTPTPDADAFTTLTEHRERPSADTVERLWENSRAHPRHVELRAALLASLPVTDPRRAAILFELVELTGDDVADRAYAAVRLLRGVGGTQM